MGQGRAKNFIEPTEDIQRIRENSTLMKMMKNTRK